AKRRVHARRGVPAQAGSQDRLHVARLRRREEDGHDAVGAPLVGDGRVHRDGEEAGRDGGGHQPPRPAHSPAATSGSPVWRLRATAATTPITSRRVSLLPGPSLRSTRSVATASCMMSALNATSPRSAPAALSVSVYSAARLRSCAARAKTSGSPT